MPLTPQEEKQLADLLAKKSQAQNSNQIGAGTYDSVYTQREIIEPFDITSKQFTGDIQSTQPPQQTQVQKLPEPDNVYSPEQEQPQSSFRDPLDYFNTNYGGFSAVGHGAGTLANISSGKYDKLTEGQRTGLKVGAGVNIALGALSGGLEAGKEVFGAFAATKRNAFVNNRVQQKQREAALEQQKRTEAEAQRQGYLQYDGSTYRQGGPIEDFAANKVVGVDKNGPWNAELEDKEVLIDNEGTPHQVVGETHENGGVKLQLEGGEKVISDNVIVDKKHQEAFKEYGVKVGKKTTYANVIEKFNKKVGIEKLDKDQAKLLSKLEKSETGVTNNATKERNREHLSNKISEIEAKKESISDLQSFFADLVYTKQEEIKKEGDYDTKKKTVVPAQKMLKISDSLSIPVMEDGGEYYTNSEENNKYFTKWAKENKYTSADQIKGFFVNGGPAKQEFKTTYGKPSKVDYTFSEFKKNPKVALERYKALARVLPEEERTQFLKDLEGAKTVQEYNKLAGKLQEFNWTTNQEAILDLAVDEDINRKGLTFLGKEFPELKKDYPNLFDSKGQAKRGLSGEDYKQYQTDIQEKYIPKLKEDRLTEYASTYQDNQAFKRGIEVDQQQFNSQEELDTWTKDKKPLTISGETYYKTDKGYYIKPLLGESTAPVKKDEVEVGTSLGEVDSFSPTKTGSTKEHINSINYNPLPPEALKVSNLNTLGYEEIGPLKVDEESAVREINRVAQGSQEIIGNNIGAQQGANLANSTGKQYTAINNAVTQKNVQNAQLANQANQANAGARLNVDNINLNRIDSYNREALIAESKTHNDVAGYIDNIYQHKVGAEYDRNNLNIIDSANPNVTLTNNNGIVHDPGGDIPLSTMSWTEAEALRKKAPEDYDNQIKLLRQRKKLAEANQNQTA